MKQLIYLFWKFWGFYFAIETRRFRCLCSVHIYNFSHVVFVSTQIDGHQLFIYKTIIYQNNLDFKMKTGCPVWDTVHYWMSRNLWLEFSVYLCINYFKHFLGLCIMLYLPLHYLTQPRVIVIFQPARRSWRYLLYHRILLCSVICFLFHCHLWNGMF
jgi:hypothetical protein